MAGQSDGSIIIDTELNSDGLKAGSAELLSALRSLTDEVKNLGTLLKETFSKPLTPEVNTSDAEQRVAALEEQVRELQSLIDEANSGQPQQTAPGANLGDTVQRASSLQKQIEAVNASVEKLEPTFQRAMSGSASAMTAFDGRATALENKIAELREQLEAAGQQKIPTEDYQWLTTEIGKADKELERLIDRQEKMREMGVKENSRQWQSLQYDIDLARQKLDTYKYDLQELENSGNAFVSGSDTSQYQQLEATLSAASNRLAEMRSGAQQSASLMGRFASAARRASENVGATARKVGGALVSALKAAGKSFLHIVSGGRSANRQLTSLISNAKKFALSMLGARGVYALLRKAVSAYMSENQELQSKLSSCWSGIGNLLGPIIERLINLVATAVSYVTSFLRLFGVFGGKATKSAKAAAGAAKELKNQVASFDELNKMGEKDSGGGGGADDIEAELPEVELPDWAKMFAEQIKSGEWAAAAETLTTALNDMVSSVDWAGVGEKIGYYLNAALTFLSTAITTFDWNNLGVSLGTMINNIITGVDWENLGTVICGKFIAIFETLGGLFATLKWDELGKAVSDTLMGMWNSIDWSQAGKTVSDGIKGVLKAITTALNEADWEQIGKDIAAFFAEIDWSGIAAGLVEAFKAALPAIFEILGGIPGEIKTAGLAFATWKFSSKFMTGVAQVMELLSGAKTSKSLTIGATIAISGLAVEASAITDSIKNGLNKVNFGEILGGGTAITAGGALVGKALGSSILGGAIGGVVAGVPAFGVGIYDAITNGLDWLNAALIGAGSTAAGAGIGAIIGSLGGPIGTGIGALIGLAVGLVTDGVLLIVDNWSAISGFFKKTWSGITGVFSKAVSGISKFTSSAWSSIKSGTVSVWNSTKSWLSSTWSSTKKLAATTWSGLRSTVSDGWKNIKTATSSTWNNIQSSLSSTWSNTKKLATSTWSSLSQTVSNGWKDIKSNTSSAWSSTKSALSDTWKNMKSEASSTWSNMKSTISDGWKNIKSETTTTWSNIKSSLSSDWSNIKSTTSSTWAELKSTISSGCSSVKSSISSGWSSIKSETSSAWSSIKSSLSSTWSSMQSTASSTVSAIKSYFANAGWSGLGSNICDGIARGIDNGWTWLKNKVSSLAQSLLSKAKSALGIHSPSRVFRDEVGLNIGYGIGEGIEGSESKVLKSVTGLADAIAEEANAGDFSIKGIVPTTEIDGVLINFTDKITDSFTSLLDRLQAIAERVTFSVPSVANGAIPYKVSAYGTADRAAETQLSSITEMSDTVDERMADLSYKLDQLIAIVKALNLNIDIEALTKMITQQQRTNIRNAGGV